MKGDEHVKNKTIFAKKDLNLIILSVFLLCGILIGSFSASYIENDTATQLSSSIANSIGHKNFEIKPLLLITIWDNLKYFLLEVFWGFTFLGVIAIPITLAVRGYFLAFSIGAIINSYGISGIWLALALFGVQSIISIPCLIAISNKSFDASKVQFTFISNGKRTFVGRVFSKKFFIVALLSVVILVILSLYDVYVTPKLAEFVFLRIN